MIETYFSIHFSGIKPLIHHIYLPVRYMSEFKVAPIQIYNARFKTYVKFHSFFPLKHAMHFWTAEEEYTVIFLSDASTQQWKLALLFILSICYAAWWNAMIMNAAVCIL